MSTERPRRCPPISCGPPGRRIQFSPRRAGPAPALDLGSVDPAHILLFSLEELRERFGAATPPGADPRHDTAAFRAFRAALLEACARAARAPLSLSMWWEGTYNGYALA